MRAEFLAVHDRQHPTVEAFQAALDEWVVEYNTERPHQSGGGRPPAERFALADRSAHRSLQIVDDPVVAPRSRAKAGPRPAGVSRWVDQRGQISLAGFGYRVGPTFAGEPVEVVVTNGLVEVLHAGVLVATHAQRLKPDQADRRPRAPVQQRARDATTGLTVTRLADGSGTVSFAGAAYSCGRAWARQSIAVTIVAGSVQLSQGGKVIRVHPIRHDRSRELGAFANPKGRPRRTSQVG